MYAKHHTLQPLSEDDDETSFNSDNTSITEEYKINPRGMASIL